MKKVIYISFLPINKRVATGWFFDYLMEQKVPVEYWYISNTAFPIKEVSEDYSKYFVTVSSYSQFEERIISEQNSNNSYVVLVGLDYRSYKLYRMLTKHNCRLYFVDWGNFPVRQKAYSMDMFLKFLLRFFKNYRSFLPNIMVSFLRYFGMIKPFDVVFTAGNFLPTVSYIKRVPVSLCDYDNYRSVKGIKEKLIEGSYCVFLDIYLPFHHDLSWVGLGLIDHKKYYESLNNFFDLIEKKYDVQVVIAAHPISNYNDKVFNNRIVLKGVTPRLVKDSQFVIAHHSTSVSYAVLNKKPLVFVYTDAMVEKYKETILSHINCLSEYLDSSMYNISKIFTQDQIYIKPVNDERYDSYKYEFLTSREVETQESKVIFLKEVRGGREL